MKVIKKQDVSNWSHKHTCMNCESDLEVESKDLRYTRVDGDIREPGYDSFTATCCVCSQSFNIPSGKIPKLIQVEVKGRGRTSDCGGSYWDR